jgi:hypothetical protein
MNRKFLIALIVLLTLAICVVLGGTVVFALQSPNLGRLIGLAPTPTVQVTTTPTRRSPNSSSSARSSSSSTSSASGILPATPLPSVSTATLDALQRTQIPFRDLYQIVPRLRKQPDLAKSIPTPTPRTRKIGDKDTFFVIENQTTGQYRTVTATLRVITPNGYFWTEDGMDIPASALQKSADFWEKTVYPTNTKYFGDAGRGLDGDTRIHILCTEFPDAAGYFSGVDSFSHLLMPYSNERNLIYMNARAVMVGSDEFNGDLAHEFQHLIHNRQQQFATGWIDEGLGDLAIKLNGFPVLGVSEQLSRQYNTQLNTWASGQAQLPHYAASYFFFNYAAQRFGPNFIRNVIHAPREGINGVQAVLDQTQNGLRFEDLFSDWAVTNYLNDPSVANGRYAYQNEPNFRVTRVPTLDTFPTTRAFQTHEYAASYLTLQPADTPNVTVYFTGTTTVKLLPVDAHGGQWMWYSNRADVSDMTLTRQFDLSKTNKATLQFWTWYDIEPNYDYGYVEVSTDAGKTWDTLKGKYTTNENPNGANYGQAYTAKSGVTGDQAPAQWVQEQIDLSPYAGKTILLRFEYITDDAYNLPGWAIDDIAIPEINYAENVESGEGGWQAAGFIRTDNVLPQKYSVQVIEFGSSTRVLPLPLDSQNRGSLTISGLGKEVSKAALVISAFAPTTTESTEYQVGVAPK